MCTVQCFGVQGDLSVVFQWGLMSNVYCCIPCYSLFLSIPPPVYQELEALAAKLEQEKKAVEDAARNLREEKDTVQQ